MQKILVDPATLEVVIGSVRMSFPEFEREAALALQKANRLWLRVYDHQNPSIYEYYAPSMPVVTAMDDFCYKHPHSFPMYERVLEDCALCKDSQDHDVAPRVQDNALKNYLAGGDPPANWSNSIQTIVRNLAMTERQY